MKDLYVYDRSAGMYVKVKHKLTQNDWHRINKIRSDGKTKMSDALDQLNLIV